jgi:hypothetical protein
MEGLMERDDFVLVLVGRFGLSDFASEFEGCFIGFGAAVADEGSRCGGEAAGRVGELDELFGEEAGVGIVVEIGGMDQLPSLFLRLLVFEISMYGL